MTEQIERVEEAAERAATAPRERTGYDAARRPGALAGVLGGRPDLRPARRRLAPSAATCWTCSRTHRATCTWVTPRRS